MRKRLLAAVLISLFCITPAWARLSDDPEGKQWAYNDTEVYDAWDYATGNRDVVVAVIDNGFDMFQPDLAGNVWKNAREIPDNGVDDDGNGYADDVWGWNFVQEDANHDGAIDEGELIGNNDPRPEVVGQGGVIDTEESIHHGTLVAGIIGAVGGNGVAGAGINWQVRLMNVKVVDNAGVGDIQNLDRAIRYAVDNGADIINISLVSDEKPGLRDAVQSAYDRGVAVIAAAGNERVWLGGFPRYPACVDADAGQQWVLGVSAMDESHHIAQFSNYGSACVDITAPGVHVSSTLRYAPQFGLTKLYSGGWSGTSFAAPIVSGAAALLKSIHPEWEAPEIYNALLKSVRKTPPTDKTAYAHLFGAGLVRVGSAVKYAISQLHNEHPLQEVVAIDKRTGDMFTRSAKDTRESTVRTPAKGTDSVAAFTLDGAVQYATAHSKKNKSVITIYDASWRKVRSWEVPIRGPLDIVVGSMGEGNIKKLVLAPKYRSRLAYAVYWITGQKQKEHTLPEAHQGVSLGLVEDQQTNQHELLAIYKEHGQTVLHHFDGAYALKREITIADLKGQGAVGAGSLLGNVEQQYVVAGGVGFGPVLYLFDSDGNQLRKFFAYDPSYRGGLSLAVGDYDADGKDDMIVVPETGGLPVRVWSSGSKLLDEWELPATQAVRNIKLLPLYTP